MTTSLALYFAFTKRKYSAGVIPAAKACLLIVRTISACLVTFAAAFLPFAAGLAGAFLTTGLSGAGGGDDGLRSAPAGLRPRFFGLDASKIFFVGTLSHADTYMNFLLINETFQEYYKYLKYEKN